MPSGLRVALPAKITSSSRCERKLRVLCSPNTQRIASTRFDFPEPFGPTTAVIPGSNSTVVCSANVLKPNRRNALRRIAFPQGRQSLQRGALLGGFLTRPAPDAEHFTADAHARGEDPFVRPSLGGLEIDRNGTGPRLLALQEARDDVESLGPVERGHEGFERIGQDRGTIAPPALLLADPEDEEFAETQTPGRRRQRLGVDERGSPAMQLAFARARITLIQPPRDDEAE